MPQVTPAMLEAAAADCDTIAAVATSSEETVLDRLGNSKRTLAGAINALGYEPPVAHASGLSFTNGAQTVEYDGAIYAAKPSAVPFTTTGTFDSSKWRLLDVGAAAAAQAAAEAAQTAAEAAQAQAAAAQAAAEAAQTEAETLVASLTAIALSRVRVRQTVLSGPTTSAGAPNFGGATGSATVTMSGTLLVTAANGFSASEVTDRVGSITNASWSGLSTNGRMYLYIDIAEDGTCTTGVTTLAPVYQAGGTYSVAAGQFTFNFTEMVGKVGNGTSAVQAYRVFVGEVTVSGGTVAAISWYALQGKAVTLSNTLTFDSSMTFSHNIGIANPVMELSLVNAVTELGYAVGDEIPVNSNIPVSASAGHAPWFNRLQAGFWWKPSLGLAHKTTGAATLFTAANWRWNMRIQRGW